MLMLLRFENFLIARLGLTDDDMSPARYRKIRRLIVILMAFVTIVPLSAMLVINAVQYRYSSIKEQLSPYYLLGNKTKHSVELFLEERLSMVKFITNAYTFDELSDPDRIHRLFAVLKKEIGGFVDLGLINSEGVMVNYAGPYTLLGKNYSSQPSFHQAQLKGTYISDVFMGHREFPHIVMAVQALTTKGDSWILRATIDTEKFSGLIQAIADDPDNDAFLINRENTLQTPSRYYGKVMETCPLDIPSGTASTHVLQRKGPEDQDLFVAFVDIAKTNYTLVIITPRTAVFESWQSLKSEMLVVYLVGVALILVAVFQISEFMVSRIRIADERRETAFRELQHSQKLSSIGRLAAGVAHEINNPLAIINEKAGLMTDLIEISGDFPNKERFGNITEAIIGSVKRCRTITHRLLGFAKRIDVEIGPLNLNDVLTEVLGFVEREATYKKIDIRMQLMRDLREINSDRGQLQQVFLNLFTNAIAAVAEGGVIQVITRISRRGQVTAEVRDNGCGMSEETLKHIFDPFFSTKKGYGTGLGLSITYGIIKKLGGYIKVQSREGEGTTFTVYLPDQPATEVEE